MKALAFDTETTGIPKHPRSKREVQPRIIEIGGVLIDAAEGAVLERFNFIVDPECQIEPIITKITGLEQSDLDGKPKFAEMLPEIEPFFKQADIMIAHNLPFDKTMVDLELERLGRKDFPFPAYRMCTVEENIPRYGYRVKLLDLYEHVTGEPLAQTHRASDDAEALAEIVLKAGYLKAYVDAITRKN